MGRNRLWSKKEIEFLIQNKDFSASILAEKLHRTKAAINQKRKALGLKPKLMWTKEKVINEIKKRHNSGKNIKAGFMNIHHTKLYRAGYRLFGSWKNVIEASGLNYKEITSFEYWNDEQIINCIIERYLNGSPLNSLQVQKENRALYQAAYKHIGSWEKAIKKAGLDYSEIRKLKPAKSFSKEEIINQIIKWENNGNPLNIQHISLKYPNFEAQARRKFGSWENAIKTAGFDYETIKLSMNNEIKRGLIFEKIMRDYFTITNPNYKYHKRIYLGNGNFLIPAFIDIKRNIWIDCKIRCWSLTVQETIEKYLPYASEIHIYYLYGKSPKNQIKIKYYNVYELSKINDFPELLNKFKQLEKEALEEIELINREKKLTNEIIIFKFDKNKIIRKKISIENIKDRINYYYKILGHFPRKIDIDKNDNLWYLIQKFGGSKKVSDKLNIPLKDPSKIIFQKQFKFIHNKIIEEEITFKEIEKRIYEYYDKLGYFPRKIDIDKNDNLWRFIQEFGGAKELSLFLNIPLKKRSSIYDWEKLSLELDSVCRELGRFPSKGDLKELGKLNLKQHIRRFGGSYEVAEKMGYTISHRKSKHWDNFKNLEQELIPICEKLGRMPAYQDLKELNKEEIYAAIQKHGGIYKVANKLNVIPLRDKNEARNWEYVTNELKKIKKKIRKFPSMIYIKENCPSRLITLITKHFGGLHNVAEKMGEKLPMKKPGYWTIDKVEKELKDIFYSIGRLPSRKDLKEINKEYLIDPIKKYGGIYKLANIMGLQYDGRKPKGYFKNIENLKKELLPLCKKLNRFPTRKELEENNLKNLIPIISREGGFKKISKEMGFERKKINQEQ